MAVKEEELPQMEKQASPRASGAENNGGAQSKTEHDHPLEGLPNYAVELTAGRRS